MATDASHTVSDRKKRSLEALERRFVSAKEEFPCLQNLVQKNNNAAAPQQQHQKKETSPSWHASPLRTHKNAVVSHEQQQRQQQPQQGSASKHSPSLSASPASEATTSSKKVGCSTTSSRMSGRLEVSGEEANVPTYFVLFEPVDENLLRSGVTLSSGGTRIVDGIINDLLVKGDTAHKYLHGSKSMKIEDRILLDGFVQRRKVPSNSCLRTLKSHSKRSKMYMSMKQHRKCGTFNLPQKFIKDVNGIGTQERGHYCPLENPAQDLVDINKFFKLYKPMHEMWKDYITQLVRNLGESKLVRCLLTADLHGAFLLVAESKVNAFTGMWGIMIRETTETFGIVTPDNRFRGKSALVWRDAMNIEIKALEENSTWDLVPLPTGQHAIGNKWVYSVKLKSGGYLDRYKARLVTLGYRQEKDNDYKETFAPVAKLTIIHNLFAVSTLKGWEISQIDVKNVFLHGDLQETVHRPQS